MTKKKITLEHTAVLQFHAGTSYEVIENDGIVYFPAFPALGATTSGKSVAADDDKAEEKETPKEKPAGRGGRSAAKEEVAEEKPKGRRGAPKEDEEEPEEKPAKGRGGRGAAKEDSLDDIKDAAQEIFEELDKGTDLTEPDAKKKLLALTSDKKLQGSITAAFDKFMKNPKLTVDEVMAIAFAPAEEAEEEKPAKGRGTAGGRGAAKKQKEPEAINPDDLQVGDKVLVHWFEYEGDDKKGTNAYDAADYEGEVVKAPRGKKGLFILYDGDDAPTAFDKDFHEIKEVIEA